MSGPHARPQSGTHPLGITGDGSIHSAACEILDLLNDIAVDLLHLSYVESSDRKDALERRLADSVDAARHRAILIRAIAEDLAPPAEEAVQ